MVHLSAFLLGRIPGPHRFWRRRAVFRQTAAMYGRRRNVYRIAVIAMQKALTHARRNRQLKYDNFRHLWEQRVDAGCHEHGYTFSSMWQGLMFAGVELNRRVLANLAVWEPRTFGAMVDVSRAATAGRQQKLPPPAARWRDDRTSIPSAAAEPDTT